MWHALDCEPTMRLETELTPVLQSNPLVLNHHSTGQVYQQCFYINKIIFLRLYVANLTSLNGLLSAKGIRSAVQQESLLTKQITTKTVFHYPLIPNKL